MKVIAASLFLLVTVLQSRAHAQSTLYVDCANQGCPGTGTPSDPYCTIQDAIDAAQDGDVVLVAPCVYVENIDFLGKAITVRSRAGAAVTTVAGSFLGPVVTFQSGEGPLSVLDGLTLTGGGSNQGGGVRCIGASPTILDATITLNRAFDFGVGAGVYCDRSSPTIVNTMITRNTVTGFGDGGGVYCTRSSPTFVGTTITGNRADQGAGGVSCQRSSDPTITNGILWNNLPGEIVADAFSNPTVRHSDVRGGFPGTGNIDLDPLFVDEANGDYRLTCESPCVEAGGAPGVTLPRFDHSGLDLRAIGTIDMGADELGTVWQFNGPAMIGDARVDFTATASPGHPSPNVSKVLLSLGDGSQVGGIRVPRSGGRRLMLDPDSIFMAWLGAPAAFRTVASLNACDGGSTEAFSFPPSLTGTTFYYAGVSWELGVGVTSVSETKSFVVR